MTRGLRALTERHSAVFVGGKGGVGKTSVASALAVAHAREGRRVLVVSTDPAHNLGHLWQRTVGDAPTRLAAFGDGLVDGVEIDPGATVERHLAGVRATMRELLPERLHAAADRHLVAARTAPGTHEAAVLERIADAAALAPADYDLVVFDTAPSGHTLRLLSLPDALRGWTDELLASRARSDRFAAALRGLGGRREAAAGVGDAEAASSRASAALSELLQRRRARFESLQDLLRDPARAGFVVVTTAEALPVAESAEIVASLRALDIAVTALVANRLAPAGTARAEREARHLADLTARCPGIPSLPIAQLDDDLIGEPALLTLAAALTPTPPPFTRDARRNDAAHSDRTHA